MPERYIFKTSDEVAAQDARHPDEAFGGDRVALVRHRRGALLAGGEGLRHLADLGALQVADLGGERLDRRSHRGERVEVLGVAVAGDHLSGGHGPQAECPADVLLHRRLDVRVGAYGAGQLPDGDRLARPAKTGAVAIGLQAVESELHAECRGLGVHAVRAAERRRGRVLDRPALERRDERVRRLDQQVGGADERRRERGVDDIGRGQPVVDPRTLRRADHLQDDVDEGRDVVVGDRLALGDRGDEGGVDDRRRARGRRGVLGGHDAELGPRLDGEHLHLEPERETRLVGEQRRHLREGVTGITRCPPRSRRCSPRARCRGGSCMPSKEISSRLVGALARRRDRRAERGDDEHAAAGGDCSAPSSSRGGPGVENGHALDRTGSVDPGDDIADAAVARVARRRDDDAHRGIRRHLDGSLGEVPAATSTSSSVTSPSMRGSTTSASGSPKRTLNSISFGPSAVSMQPA